MVILVIGRFFPEAFAQHIGDTLEEMGHIVLRADVGVKHRPGAGTMGKRLNQMKAVLYEAAKHVPAISRRTDSRLYAVARQQPIELTLVCHDFLLPEQVSTLKRLTEAPVVLWYPDSVWSFGRALFLNAGYDGLFFKDPYLVRRISRDLDKPAFYLPECCNPRYHRSVPVSAEDRARYECDITTAGNLYSYRVAFFEQLVGYRARVWGNPPPLWMDVSPIRSMLGGRYVAHEEKAKAFLCAKAVVNNLHAGEIWGVNVRTFEIAAVGGFQLISNRPGLSQLFNVGAELVAFDDLTDLKAKLDHYLHSEAERTTISAAGMKRAHRDHTYRRRLDVLLATVFGSACGFEMPDLDLNVTQR